jgi:hypothetical protein
MFIGKKRNCEREREREREKEMIWSDLKHTSQPKGKSQKTGNILPAAGFRSDHGVFFFFFFYLGGRVWR